MTQPPDYYQLLQQQIAINTSLQESIAALRQTMAEQTLLIQSLQQQLEQNLRARFGKKSERQKKITPLKTSLNKSPVEDSQSQQLLPATMPRQSIEHDLDEGQKQCPHCAIPLHSIKPLETEQLAYRPGSLYVKRHVRHRYACRRCSQTIITASMPNQPIERGLADSSLLAQIIIDKYQDHLPLYRQEVRWKRLGILLARSTLCEWVLSCATLLAPLVNEMKQDILRAQKIHTDDTPVPVLAKGKTHQGRLWVYIGGCGNTLPVAIVYEYTPTRSQMGPKNFLKDYTGFLQADAYAGYDCLYESQKIIEVGCFAHMRRKFVEAYECSGEQETTIQSISQRVVDLVGQLYDIERIARALTATERYYYRLKYAKPLLKQLYRYMKKQQHRVLPKSLLGKALQYALNHWQALTNYLRDGGLDIDNNVAERSIKPVVLGRKNYLFAGSHEGASAAATLYSLIETCKLFGINTYDYFTDVLTRLPNTLYKDIRQLLPYCWKPLNSN